MHGDKMGEIRLPNSLADSFARQATRLAKCIAAEHRTIISFQYWCFRVPGNGFSTYLHTTPLLVPLIVHSVDTLYYIYAPQTLSPILSRS
ncbi:hypothetical protein Y032_0004g1924 [Ancylostoma ceylanicum]|uniref:Uncharacterized protein n=1 Tax=Ancylostoma ceylanicum TaxID=53326 RepID=A0A016VUT7_9BILA|nr:hypothetical protein Y032_0004g1924 [Ancylostoma ceylanicum]